MQGQVLIGLLSTLCWKFYLQASGGALVAGGDRPAPTEPTGENTFSARRKYPKTRQGEAPPARLRAKYALRAQVSLPPGPPEDRGRAR